MALDLPVVDVVDNGVMRSLSRPSVAAPERNASPSDGEGPRLRFAYLDGVRGLTALYIVLFHVWTQLAWGHAATFPLLYSPWFKWVTYGHHAVVVFIVLSGYFLMLPAVRDGRLPGGSGEYLRRRARRILPPYYAALTFSLVLQALTPRAHLGRGELSAGSVLSHVFLIHNLVLAWVFTLNNPLWSVATEWQIYFFFPALLLPLWRWGGNRAAVAGGLVAGVAADQFTHGALAGACPWYLGLFALGMAAAVLCLSERPVHVRCRERVRWDHMTLGMAVAIAACYTLAPRLLGVAATSHGFLVLMDILVGSAAACGLVAAHQHTRPRRGLSGRLIALLESRPLILLGAFSYSLYLTHWPILSALCRSLLSLPPEARLLMFSGIGIPLCLGLAYLFHLGFEKPFLSARRQPSGGDRYSPRKTP